MQTGRKILGIGLRATFKPGHSGQWGLSAASSEWGASRDLTQHSPEPYLSSAHPKQDYFQLKSLHDTYALRKLDCLKVSLNLDACQSYWRETRAMLHWKYIAQGYQHDFALSPLGRRAPCLNDPLFPEHPPQIFLLWRTLKCPQLSEQGDGTLSRNHLSHQWQTFPRNWTSYFLILRHFD